MRQHSRNHRKRQKYRGEDAESAGCPYNLFGFQVLFPLLKRWLVVGD